MKTARKSSAITLASGVIATLAFAALPAGAQSIGKDACAAQSTAAVYVTSVSDGRSLVLGDGREILLAAIETPGAWAHEVLRSLVAGRAVTVDPSSGTPDRYGRIAGRVFFALDDALRPLDGELVARGAAMVGMPAAGPRNSPDPCRPALLSAENRARTARLGLWGDPDYDTKAADNPTLILASKGRFAVIEGKVVSVRESRGTIYVNFGRRWSEDFTVTILKRIGARFVAAGLDPQRLEGRRVRVRGFVEERGGPWIEAAAPEQFEIAESR